MAPQGFNEVLGFYNYNGYIRIGRLLRSRADSPLHVQGAKSESLEVQVSSSGFKGGGV